MTKYFLLIFFTLSALADNKVTRIKVIDFENPKAISSIRIAGGADSGAAVQAEQDPKLVLEGKTSLRMKLPTFKNKGPRWPHFFLRPSAFKFTDWRPFHRLTCEIRTITGQRVRLSIGPVGRARHPQIQYFNPGISKFTYTLPELLRKDSQIKKMLICGTDLQVDTDMVIDNFVLELDHKLLHQEIADFQRLATAEGSPRIQAAAKKLSGSDKLAIARQLVQLKDRLVQEHKQKIEKETVHLHREFEQKFPRKPWGYGSAGALTRVFRQLPFKGSIRQALSVSLAKNENEGIQLVLRAKRTIKNVRIKISPLTGPGGAKLTNIKHYLVGHVKTNTPRYRVRVQSQWRPDPLLDFLPAFTLDAKVFQALWLDVQTSKDQTPGLYKGYVSVTGDGVPELKVPLQVKVWNFTLPTHLTFPTIFTYSTNYKHFIYEKDKKAQKQFRSYMRNWVKYEKISPKAKRLVDLAKKSRSLLLDHKIMPDNLYSGVQTPPKTADIQNGIKRGGNLFNLTYITHVVGIKKGDSYPAWRKKSYLNYLRKETVKYKKNGLFKNAYVYAFDEVKAESYPAAREMLNALKDEFPDLKIVTTLRDYSYGIDSGLRDYVDVWIPVTPSYAKSSKAIEAARKAGKKVWYYTADWPYYPYANLNLEDPASGQRLLTGFMARQQNSDGFLYWQTTSWKTNAKLITKGPLTENDGGSSIHYHNGAGILLYPTPNGPIPCLRLKYIRDGLEDYEYTELLRQLDPAKLTLKQKQTRQQLLSVPAQVCTAPDKYDETGKYLLAYRQRLGDFLSEVK